MITVPEWRLNAAPGVPLAKAMGVPARGSSIGAALPQDQGALDRILRPESAMRWSGMPSTWYTPQTIESLLRNALGGDIVSQWELFDLMEDTWPRLLKNLGELKRSVASMDWKVEAWCEDGQTPTADAVERANLVSHIIWKMRPDAALGDHDFGGLVVDLMDAWGKGVSVSELLWEQRSNDRFGEFWALQGVQWVHPNNYGLMADGSLGLRWAGRTAPVEPFPRCKFLVGIAQARTAHFSVAALLRPLAWWWCASSFSADWLLNYAQIFGVPVRFAKYPWKADDSLIAKIGDMLANMGSAGWGSFPEGTSIELLEGSKGAGTSPQESVLDRADKQCDLLILGQTLTTDVGQSGSRALGDVHMSVRSDVIQAATDWVAGILTHQLVPAILELNYGDAEFSPEIEGEPRSQEDRLANAQRDKILLDAGIPLPAAWFYERHNIPIPKSGEAIISGTSAGAPPPGGRLPAGPPPDSGGMIEGKAADSGRGPADRAHSRIERIAYQAIAESVGARTRWLEPVAKEMDRIIAAAADNRMTDAELIAFLEAARRKLPELFGRMDHTALAQSLEAAMGAATVAGVQDRLKAQS